MTDEFADISPFDDSIPVDGSYRGVALHAGQSLERLKIVKRDIDHVLSIVDLNTLYRLSGDIALAPEARLAAAAKAEAGLVQRRDARSHAPGFDLDDLRCKAAGARTRKWRHPLFYCAMGEVWPEQEATTRAARRERPLTDAERS